MDVWLWWVLGAVLAVSVLGFVLAHRLQSGPETDDQAVVPDTYFDELMRAAAVELDRQCGVRFGGARTGRVQPSVRLSKPHKRRVGTLRAACLSALDTANKPLTVRQVRALMQADPDRRHNPPGSVRDALSKLAADGKIVRVRHGVYASASWVRANTIWAP